MKDTDFRTLMESLDNINEGVDRSPEDLQNNHPDIYEFITDITGPYSIQTAKVHSFDLGGAHHVYVELQPTAGIANTKAVMDGMNIAYTEKGNGITGNANNFVFNIKDDGQRGNITETWGFVIQKQSNNAIELDMQDIADMDELLIAYNEEFANENEATQTADNEITVNAYGTEQDLFIGDLEDFKEYCGEHGIELTTGYDDESAYGLTTAQRNY